MLFDFKKEYKEFYMPKGVPEIVDVPAADYLAVRGSGDPNEPEGEYHNAIEILYSLAFTLKMSAKSGHNMDGFFEYVVPPLEGFWWQDGVCGIDYRNKASFNWVSVLRLPDFVTVEDFNWAVDTVQKKKGKDCSRAELLCVDEGLCVQIMHTGSYDDEPASVAIMDTFIAENGYENDITSERLHHEIYISDARRVPPERRKTVLRHPIKKQ